MHEQKIPRTFFFGVHLDDFVDLFLIRRRGNVRCGKVQRSTLPLIRIRFKAANGITQ